MPKRALSFLRFNRMAGYYLLKIFCGQSESVHDAIGEAGLNDIILTTDDGVKIYALYAEPENINKDTNYTIFLHGRSENRFAFYKIIAQKFLKHNFAVLVPDYRGISDSDGTVSASGFSKDIKAAVKYLNEKRKGENNVSIVATSLGAAIAVNYLAETRENITTVLLAPFLSAVDLISDSPDLKGALGLMYVPFFKNIVKNSLDFDVGSKIKNVKGKLLIVHGDKDTMIPSQHSIALQKICGCKLHIAKDVDHLSIQRDEDVIDLTVKFIKENPAILL